VEEEEDSFFLILEIVLTVVLIVVADLSGSAVITGSEQSETLRAFLEFECSSSFAKEVVKDDVSSELGAAAGVETSRAWRWDNKISRRLFLAAEASGMSIMEVEGIATTAAIIIVYC